MTCVQSKPRYLTKDFLYPVIISIANSSMSFLFYFILFWLCIIFK